jgi:AraC-like DNA-binding protein
MEKINIAFHIVSFLLALLAACLLLLVNKECKHANRLLAFVLIMFGFQNLILVLLFSKLIMNTPWLLRTFAPTTFLIAPAAFIYIRSILNDELKFRKYDWLFLIPAILVLINFIPYYLLPLREKIEYLNQHFYGKNPSNDPAKGFIPGTAYYIARVCWSGIFLFNGFRLIECFKKSSVPELVSKNKVLLKWLLIFNSLLTAVLVATLIKVFIPPLKNTHFTIADVILGASILFICLQLFIRPQILYGVFKPLTVTGSHHRVFADEGKLQVADVLTELSRSACNAQGFSPVNITPLEQLQYKNLIENYFQEKKPFLQTEYSLEQLVIDIQVPRYILSAFINQEYGMGFREYLNRYRVDFFKIHLGNPSWGNLTLEAIAEECGFNSRSTFINNFKRITGQTPSEFIKDQKGVLKHR